MKSLAICVVLITASTLAMRAAPIDPLSLVESRLKTMKCDAPITSKTNETDVLCSIHCRDLDERDAVYDAFRDLPKLSLSATKEPPTVSVAIVFDPAAYEVMAKGQLTESKLQSEIMSIKGKVLQKVEAGLLVQTAEGRMVLVVDGPQLIDEDPINVIGYLVGDYQYSSINGKATANDSSGTRQTVRKYTCNRNVARDYWTPFAEARAKAEREKRATPQL